MLLQNLLDIDAALFVRAHVFGMGHYYSSEYDVPEVLFKNDMNENMCGIKMGKNCCFYFF